MEAVPVPLDRQNDVAGRDPCRTPMVWRDDEGAGFTAAGIEPWLPIGDRSRNVEAQRGNPKSILNLTHDLIALRKHRLILTGAYEPVDAPEGVWAFRREGGAFVGLNLGDEDAALEGVQGTILIGSDRARDDEIVGGLLELAPLEAAIVATAEPSWDEFRSRSG
jgi:alpha-glucosidase